MHETLTRHLELYFMIKQSGQRNHAVTEYHIGLHRSQSELMHASAPNPNFNVHRFAGGKTHQQVWTFRYLSVLEGFPVEFDLVTGNACMIRIEEGVCGDIYWRHILEDLPFVMVRVLQKRIPFGINFIQHIRCQA